GRILRRAPIAPTSVATLLGNDEGEREFRRIVRAILPDAEAEILAARHDGASRENAPAWAFLRKVEEEHFPCYEVDEYRQIAFGIPFVRNGWSYDRFHELDLPRGELLLFALCAQPYAPEFDTRVAALDAASSVVSEDLLREIPAGGFPPAELHARLDGTPYAALAGFADWLWGEISSDCKGLGNRPWLPMMSKSTLAGLPWQGPAVARYDRPSSVAMACSCHR
ncbi:MAG: hypothetical protein ACRDIY_21095, partial [Chloroflexota bacterium]